ncbi:MAG: HAMP domain-containing sensor histidine kinase [Phycisphaerales bacterium]
METVLKSTSLVQRAHWLIRLRWVAIAALGCATFGASEFMGVALPSGVLYGIAAVLLVYNLALRQVLVYWTRAGQEPSEARVGGVLTFQISADLFILTMILHFSGGVENPFLLFFAFHMIIASILRSRRQSYLQATLAVTLFGGLVVLEAAGGIAHYSLEGFAGHQLYRDWTYVFGMLFVFTVTLYVIVYMTTSISEQLRRRQEDLEKANAQLQEKDQVKNEYVLRVTHDIKGHLAAVLSCLDLVHGEILGPLNEKQKDFVGRAHRRTTSCLEFAKALLKLTRMKLTGRLEIEQFSLKKVILNVLALVQNKAQSKSILLSHQIDPGIDKIWGEAVLVEETIANILFNAVKYTPDGGKVSLEARPEGNLVWIRVTDTGIGVPDGDSPRIFEEFYRAENARETERDGTGLGLAFARQVVERHGGRIWVEGNPGGGSIFTFTLPLRPSGGGG